MAVDHIKVVTVDPVSDAYSWSMIDSATNSTPSWVAITNQQSNGQDTDTWIFTVQVNISAARQAIATVTHSTGITDSFTIDQAGNVGSPSPSSYSSITVNSNPVNEGQNLTFTVSGNNLSDGTVPYTLSGAGITAGDIGIGSTGTIGIVGATNSGSLTVPITADQLTEGNETIVMTLGSADSNGVGTGSLQANTVISDTSTTADTQVQLQFTNAINIIGNPNMAQFNVSDINLLSGTISNSTVAVSGIAGGAQFEAVAGETVQFEIELTRVSSPFAYIFTQVGGNPVATIPNISNYPGLSKISEDLTGAGFPNVMTMVVEFDVPSQTSVNHSVLLNATTIPEPVTSFSFTQGTIGSTPFAITQNGTNHSMTTNNIMKTMNIGFDAGSQPAVGDFSLPSNAWISFGGQGGPISWDSNTNTGTLALNISSNQTTNSRTHTIAYTGGLLGSPNAVIGITLTQTGTLMGQGPQGNQGSQQGFYTPTN